MPELRCRLCATSRDPADPDVLGWAWEAGPDGGTWLCPPCARQHVRDIEARLTAEWWG